MSRFNIALVFQVVFMSVYVINKCHKRFGSSVISTQSKCHMFPNFLSFFLLTENFNKANFAFTFCKHQPRHSYH